MFWLKREFQKLNWQVIGNIVGMVLIALACLMLLPVICGLIYKEIDDVLCFLLVIGISLILGFPLSRLKVKHAQYFARDGLIAVGLCWLVVSVFGALPFYISGTIPKFIDCFFETVSGFTTTGSSILPEVESLPRCMLFWRSFTHWVGGMGILVFVLAILPKSNDHSMHLLRAESPGPVIDKLVPRLRKSSFILYSIYMALTIIEILFLLVGKMPLFDTLCNTFGTAGTGGFSVTNQGIGQYGNAYYEIVISIFMILFGINFNFYFLMLIKEFKTAFKMEEVRVYLLIILTSVTMIALNIAPLYDGSYVQAFRYSLFQVASIMTTTGYSSFNFDLWPTFSKIILLLLMVVGACAGSTGGGIKVSRLIILVKKIRLDLQKTIHPNKVQVVTSEGKAIPKRVVDQVTGYFSCFMLLVAIITLIVSLDGKDFETTVSAVFACIGNIGPGFGVCGPFGNFGSFSTLSKLVLSIAMLIGRLEIYPILIFIAPFVGKEYKLRHKYEDSVNEFMDEDSV